LTRFSAALAQLEGAVAETASRADKENVLLKQEREQLLSRLAALEEESSSLVGLTQAVESRLDGAIAEIRAALSRS
jgi:hypothetical protein